MNINRVKYTEIEQIPQLKLNPEFKQNFSGSSPAPFIGRAGYPQINLGLLSPQIFTDTLKYDSPNYWQAHNYQIGEIASLRYSLVNSRMKVNVKQLKGKFLEICQEVGMASKPAELEISLKTKPQLVLKPTLEIIPFGPTSEVQRARLTSNTKIDFQVEKIVRDTDLKSLLGIWNLYQKGFEENILSKLLSVGNLGEKKDRKLVPTRWSITAVDDLIGKELWQQIKNFPTGEYSCYFGGGWGNYYLFLFFPEIWSFELFETYLKLGSGEKVLPAPNHLQVSSERVMRGCILREHSAFDDHVKQVRSWQSSESEIFTRAVDQKINPWSRQGYAYSTNYEDYGGRKTYAEETAGGYYACRLPILEKMKELKRQGAVLALRFITPEYNVPLGVWVCREASRKSLAEKPWQFASKDLLLKYAYEFIAQKFGFDLNLLLKESRLLQNQKQQKKLGEF